MVARGEGGGGDAAGGGRTVGIVWLGLRGVRSGEGCWSGELHDIYLRPWRRYAAAGGRGAMLAHNAINDVPCAEAPGSAHSFSLLGALSLRSEDHV